MFQASLPLLDGPDGDAGGPAPPAPHRVTLGEGAWLDVHRSWLPDADALFERLLTAVPWQAERRRMYDRVVDVPRLQRFYPANAELPDPALTRARDSLSAHYLPDLGEPFTTTGLCLYRDHRDGVAWHGDRFGRGATDDTVVAIVSLGTPRTLALRPRDGGGPTTRYEIGHGDLLTMGGTCQRTHDHAIPKSSRTQGSRISVQFRPGNVR